MLLVYRLQALRESLSKSTTITVSKLKVADITYQFCNPSVLNCCFAMEVLSSFAVKAAARRSHSRGAFSQPIMPFHLTGIISHQRLAPIRQYSSFLVFYMTILAMISLAVGDTQCDPQLTCVHGQCQLVKAVASTAVDSAQQRLTTPSLDQSLPVLASSSNVSYMCVCDEKWSGPTCDVYSCSGRVT